MTERLESDENISEQTAIAADPDSVSAESAAEEAAEQVEQAEAEGRTTVAEQVEEEQQRMAEAEAQGEDFAGETAAAVAAEESTAREEQGELERAEAEEAAGEPGAPGEASVESVPAVEGESPAEEDGAEQDGAEQTPEPLTSQQPPAPSPQAPRVPTPAAVKPSATPSAPAAPSAASEPGVSPEQLAEARAFGEVEPDGSVYLLVHGERVLVGQVPEVPEDEALAYFAKKFVEVRTQVELLEQRVQAGASSSDMTRSSDRIRQQLNDRKLVGDVAALEARLEALRPRLKELEAEHRRAAEAAKAEHLAERESIVAEAEQIAGQDPEKTQWKSTSSRMAELFEQWKTHQKSGGKLSRKDEESLWKRFRGARTTFDRHRRAFFSQLDERNSEAKKAKEKLIREAEALSSSTEWGPTSGKLRDLMDRWKEAPRASRKDDDALWARFRAAQDVFFAARKESDKEVDREFEANLVLKQELITEARQLLPVTDAKAARKKLAAIQARWEEIGKVPRNDFKRVENELGEVEDAIREADSGSRIKAASATEVRSSALQVQAEEKVTELQEQIDAAQASGNTARAEKLSGELSSAQSMLEMIRRSAASL